MTAEHRILKAAEDRIRSGGYNGFSFRDIARDTGLTNAGVHHHFPTKAALVARVAELYTERFLAALDTVGPKDRVPHLRALFAESIRDDGRMCLCGLLAAESHSLPAEVGQGARRFFEALTGRLVESFATSEDPEGAALAVLAHLEGAVLLARALDDPAVFDRATRNLAG